ncbi:hypothetical protein D3C76_1235870 [compost metagenome]
MRAPLTLSTRCAVKRLRFSATLAQLRWEMRLKLQVASTSKGTVAARLRKNRGSIRHSITDASAQRSKAPSNSGGPWISNGSRASTSRSTREMIRPALVRSK